MLLSAFPARCLESIHIPTLRVYNVDPLQSLNVRARVPANTDVPILKPQDLDSLTI